MATSASASAASRFTAATEAAGLPLELREHATITTLGGFELQWVYFFEAEFRLFVFEGPAVAIDTLLLTLAEDEYVFGAAQGSSSLVSHREGNNGMSLFLRSEAIESSAEALTRAQLVELADLISSS